MPPLLTVTEKLRAETAAIRKEIARKLKEIRDVEEETRELKKEIIGKYGVKPVTGQKRQRDVAIDLESSSSSEEKKCTGCSSCQGPLASDGEDADDEYEHAGGKSAAGSSKNS